jgi:hypothetical protein
MHGTFLINLQFGTRLIGVPVTFNLSVRDVLLIAARTAGLDPSMIRLRYGDVELHPDGVLRNYISHQNFMGVVITVVPATFLSTPVIVARPDIGQPSPPASFFDASPGPTPNFVFQPYQINMAYEYSNCYDERVERQTVWDSMLVSQLRGVVATMSQVHPDTIFLVL